MDGVLVDSEPMHFRATNRLFAQWNRSIPFEIYERFIGRGELETWSDWQQRFDLPSTLPELYAAIDEARLHEIALGVEPIQPAIDLARALAACGSRLAIASASSCPVIDGMMRALGLDDVFPVRISGEDPEVARSKPAPDIYLRATRVLGVDTRLSLAIEDSGPGVSSAKAAGLWCVAVPGPWTRHQDLSPADLVLESLSDLPLPER